ncbi:hypothetical protein GUJ93_ZPchr0010g8950 [Zizania palustris]|uniref:Uncharacterized protein n=1 Tax=Zizania palustris TaxID=103762 RepID=A0A8J5WAT3_ZIZPA|nr:hypothetical protein GUJ93_ZPchr0010g8950 [Zizania palustris]
MKATDGGQMADADGEFRRDGNVDGCLTHRGRCGLHVGQAEGDDDGGDAVGIEEDLPMEDVLLSTQPELGEVGDGADKAKGADGNDSGVSDDRDGVANLLSVHVDGFQNAKTIG